MNKQQLKSDIRQQIRKKRNLVTPSENSILGARLNQQLIQHNLLTAHQNITCFLSFDGEISTNSIIQNIFKLNKSCYLPRLIIKTKTTPNKLLFLPYNQTSTMVENHYGIPEIDLENEQAIKIENLDLVLAPLVAFDLSGNRLGMGGGYYDATFESIKGQTKRPEFIGLAHDFQEVDSVPKDDWDLPLDGICTPTRFLRFKK